MIIIRYSEINLKGKNRKRFELQLIKNIKSRFNNLKIKRLRNRILIYTDKKLDLTKVFGIASFSYADELDLNLDIINKKALSLVKNNKTNKKQGFSARRKPKKPFSTFRISCQRLDKSIKFSSFDIQKKVGAHVVEKTKSKVNLQNPEINIQIELFNNHAYVFTKKIKGPGGLPVGSEAPVAALITDKNSIKAALSVMKRGCSVIPVAYTKKNISELRKYGLKQSLVIIKNISDIEKLKTKALVVGQTLKNFRQIKTNLLVLRPRIAK